MNVKAGDGGAGAVGSSKLERGCVHLKEDAHAFEDDIGRSVSHSVGISTAISVSALLAQSTTRVSVDSAGQQANESSNGWIISADGRFVALSS